MDWREDVWDRFRRDLPDLILIWTVVIAAVVGIEFVSGGAIDPVALFAGTIVVGVAITPLMWMRYERPVVRPGERQLRRTLALVGIGCLWAVAALLAGVLVIALLGFE